MKRQCHCSGSCVPPSSALNRRDFLTRSAAGAAALLTTPAWWPARLSAAELDQWLNAVAAPGPGRVFRHDVHTDARLHLGGIGTGNFEIGPDGRLTTWQLFNTLRDGEVPFCFAAKAGDTARLLQTGGGPDAPKVAGITMTGDYPFATLRYAEPAFPVAIELEAFTPFAPLDAALSSLPLAAFVFRITNSTDRPQSVSLAALLTNPVGYDASGPALTGRHPACGGNVNEPLAAGAGSGLGLRAESGSEGALAQSVRLFVSANLAALNAPPADRPANLRVATVEELGKAGPAAAGERRVIWLEDAPADLPETQLREIRDAVRAGATLVFAGAALPLLGHYAAATGGQPLANAGGRSDLVFEDFELGYERWTITGDAFGERPPGGTLANQQRVSGFLGHGLVNTYRNGDVTTGRAVSRDFPIERRFIRFLIGGGSQANTQLRLVVGGRTVREASGRDNEQLLARSWNVAEFAGQTGHLEIVDENTGPWGHVNVDQIEFTDQPANRAVIELLEELLPVRLRHIRPAADADLAARAPVTLEGLSLRDGASENAADHLRAYGWAFGSGRVVVVGGPLLPPAHAGFTVARQPALERVLHLAGIDYRGFRGQHPKAPGFGSLALAAMAGKATVLPDAGDWPQAWAAFAREGGWREAAAATATPPSPVGKTLTGGVATTVTVPPGGRVEVPFLFAWHFPNKYNGDGVWMGCHYATRWPDARAVLAEAATQFPAWRARTELFRATFHDSTLPAWLLDCLTANAAIIRHIGVVFRIANGDVYGWEGSNGCCQPTCTHVWGYEQSLARLFPDLEREMRRIDFHHQQRPDGGVNNRTDVPSPPRPTGEQPFADGHASCVLKAFREALNAPDDALLRDYWPRVRRAVDYLIERDAQSHGGQPAGYLEDDQWNTYDEALHGVTTFISGYYLAALRAGEDWARRLGETADAERFHAVFERGQRKLIELCWNGEYYQQHLPGYEQRSGEVGPGCMSDQLIGQWWAHQLGLGYLFPRDQVVSGLKAVFRHNWKADLTGWKHIPRAFAGDGDKGLIIVTWPKGGRPNNVMLYSDEVWTGIEYQVAAHLIYEGLVKEGLAVAKAARDRYDGVPRPPIPRNPWNEIECGGHYARALSSWSLLLALSGWEYDGPRRALRVGPRLQPEDFRAFFAAPEGWGRLAQKVQADRQTVELDVRWGRLAVRTLDVAVAGKSAPTRAVVNAEGRVRSARLRVANGRAEIQLDEELILNAAQTLTLELA